MSKYEPLTDFLAQQTKEPVRLSLRDVERVLGFELPKSAKLYAAWWSNTEDSHVQASAWLAAGYETTEVNLKAGKVTFVPADRDVSVGGSTGPLSPSGSGPARHPAFGAWKGKVTLLPDYDYTQPADPDWGKAYDN